MTVKSRSMTLILPGAAIVAIVALRALLELRPDPWPMSSWGTCAATWPTHSAAAPACW